jgi:hypothetical protein
VWIVAALFAVPSALCNYFSEGDFTGRLVYYKHVVIFELLVSCVLPLCVIAFSYIKTARHLVESSRPICEGTQNPKLKTRRNTAKIVVGLTVVFVISYLPYHTLWTYLICTQIAKNYFDKITFPFPTNNNIDIVYKLNDKLLYPYLLSICFLLINSCFNPVALFCTSSQFRQHLKRYLNCFCKINSPLTDIELAGRN